MVNLADESEDDIDTKLFEPVLKKINREDSLDSLKALGIGSDLDILVEFPENFTGNKLQVLNEAKDFINSAEKYLGLEHNSSSIKKSIVPVGDVKDYDEQFGEKGYKNAVKQGGSTLDWLAFPVSSTQKSTLRMPKGHTDIMKAFLRGELQYVKGQGEYENNIDEKQTIRGLRALLEIPFLSLSKEGSQLLNDELDKLIQKGSLESKTREQFEKMVRNARFQGAHNRFVTSIPGLSKDELNKRLAEIINQHKNNTLPLIPEFLEKKIIKARQGRDKGELKKDGYLMDVNEFIQTYTDNGILHHGTPEIVNLLNMIRNGLVVSNTKQGIAAFGRGVYTTKDKSTAKGYAQDKGLTLELKVNNLPDLRVFDATSDQNKGLIDQLKTEYTDKDIYEVLAREYDIDIIINGHILIQNADAIKLPKNALTLIEQQIELVTKEMEAFLADKTSSIYNIKQTLDYWVEYTHPHKVYLQLAIFNDSDFKQRANKYFPLLKKCIEKLLIQGATQKETALYILLQPSLWAEEDFINQSIKIEFPDLKNLTKQYILDFSHLIEDMNQYKTFINLWNNYCGKWNKEIGQTTKDKLLSYKFTKREDYIHLMSDLIKIENEEEINELLLKVEKLNLIFNDYLKYHDHINTFDIQKLEYVCELKKAEVIDKIEYLPNIISFINNLPEDPTKGIEVVINLKKAKVIDEVYLFNINAFINELPEDPTKGVEVLSKLKNAGLIDEINNLSFIIDFINKLPKDPTKGVEVLSKLKNAGLIDKINNLSSINKFINNLENGPTLGTEALIKLKNAGLIDKIHQLSGLAGFINNSLEDSTKGIEALVELKKAGLIDKIQKLSGLADFINKLQKDPTLGTEALIELKKAGLIDKIYISSGLADFINKLQKDPTLGTEALIELKKAGLIDKIYISSGLADFINNPQEDLTKKIEALIKLKNEGLISKLTSLYGIDTLLNNPLGIKILTQLKNEGLIDKLTSLYGIDDLLGYDQEKLTLGINELIQLKNTGDIKKFESIDKLKSYLIKKIYKDEPIYYDDIF